MGFNLRNLEHFYCILKVWVSLCMHDTSFFNKRAYGCFRAHACCCPFRDKAGW